LEDVIAAEHLRTTVNECTATPVLDHIAFKKSAGTFNYIYTKPSRTLNRVAGQVAETCGTAQDTLRPAVDGESLQGYTLRILNVHDRQGPAGGIRDRCAFLRNKRQPIHTLNHQSFFALTGNNYGVWPLRIARQHMQGSANRVVPVTIHVKIDCLGAPNCPANSHQQQEYEKSCPLLHNGLLFHFSECHVAFVLVVPHASTRAKAWVRGSSPSWR